MGPIEGDTNQKTKKSEGAAGRRVLELVFMALQRKKVVTFHTSRGGAAVGGVTGKKTERKEVCAQGQKKGKAKQKVNTGEGKENASKVEGQADIRLIAKDGVEKGASLCKSPKVMKRKEAGERKRKIEARKSTKKGSQQSCWEITGVQIRSKKKRGPPKTEKKTSLN